MGRRNSWERNLIRLLVGGLPGSTELDRMAMLPALCIPKAANRGTGHLSISRDASKALLVLCEHPTAPLNSNFLGADTSGTEPGVWCQDQVGSGTMTIAPHGHSDTQIPHPLQ